MATEPNWHPVDEEIEQILADNPGLLQELQADDAAYDRGGLEVVPDDEVRRRLEALGLKLSPSSEPDPDKPTP